jgi:hypothetical protein
MTPKEKAEELVSRFIVHTNLFNPDNPNNNGWEKDIDSAKKCALIAVDEILNDLKESLEIAEGLHPHAKGLISGSLVAWQKVKTEIEKL